MRRGAALVAALALVGGPLLSVAPTATAAPARDAAQTPAPSGPAALPAQSAWQPYAIQLVDRLSGEPDVYNDPYGVDWATTRLDAGDTPTPVARYISRVYWAVVDPLNDVYQRLLGRPGDPMGLAHWASTVQVDGPFESVIAAIAGTPEFAAHNPTNAARVAALYQLMLGRAPDPGGTAYWTGVLAQGFSPGQLVGPLWRTPEYGARVTDAAFEQILWRAPDPGGRAYWQHRVYADGLGVLDVRALLAASPELQGFGCDPIGTGDGGAGSCMLPWPNDHYTVADPNTGTGRRLNLKASFLPANVNGVHISPVQPNRSDGFSPGSTLMLQVPGIDLAKTGVPTVDNIDAYSATDAPIVLIDTATGDRVPIWVELDVHAAYDNSAQQVLLIHPATNLADGGHYVVGLRNLRDAAGDLIAPGPVFQAIRDRGTSPVGGFAQRADELAPTFTALADAGVARGNLYLAWDFTVASTENLTGRMLHLRDDAFARLGDHAPAFTVTSNTPGTRDGIARVVEGTFQVPKYLTGTGAPGSVFNEDSLSGIPQAYGSFTANFRCVVPTAALTTAARPSLYGHGLFGSLSEVTAGNVQAMASEHDFVFCGTLWSGMADEDIPTAAGVLTDLSNFNKLADRVQQGVLDMLFLGRLMKSPDGFITNAAFQKDGGAPAIDTSELYYDGNSQGGILGGMATAVATDWTKAVLGVSGMNYSLLLPRSVDFDTFEAVMKAGYPGELQRLLGLSVIQLEWDRAEPDGYANHMVDGSLPGTPAHRVLMQIAFGDHQVSNVSADTQARTIGARTNCPSLAAGRSPGTLTLWNVPCIATFPYAGSAIVYWDSGSAAPPLSNVAPTESDTVAGHDPHSDPRNSAVARQQKSDFLSPAGTVTDVCTGQPCTAGS